MKKGSMTPRKAMEIYRVGLIVSVALAVAIGGLNQIGIVKEPAFLALALLPCLAGAGIYLKYGKCPHCGKPLPLRYRKELIRCPSCKGELED